MSGFVVVPRLLSFRASRNLSLVHHQWVHPIASREAAIVSSSFGHGFGYSSFGFSSSIRYQQKPRTELHRAVTREQKIERRCVDSWERIRQWTRKGCRGNQGNSAEVGSVQSAVYFGSGD